MALIHSLEASGNFLFKHRGQLPIVLFLLAVPVIYLTDFYEYAPPIRKFTLISGVVTSFLGFLVRAYTIGTTPKGTSGRNTEKQIAEQLNTTGIYSMLRHPLYLGNYLMWIGIVIFTGNFWFVLLVSLMFWLYYERIMFAEERFLERKFGQAYIEWSLRVPAFVPALQKFKPSAVPFSMKSVLRREYPGVLNTVLGFTFVEVVREVFARGNHYITGETFIPLAIAAVLALTLRILKRHTPLLLENDRS